MIESRTDRGDIRQAADLLRYNAVIAVSRVVSELPGGVLAP